MITTRATPTPIPALAPFVRPPCEAIPVAVVVGIDGLELPEDVVGIDGLELPEDGAEVLETAAAPVS
jgi:hypothetical protein